MTNILVLRNSILGSASASNELVDMAVKAIRHSQPEPRIVVRDLALDPVPHLSEEGAAALRGQTPETAEQAKAQALSDLLISELAAADTVVIGAPMYNFGMPSTLKSWFDYVLRAGLTFSYTEAGPVGLMKDKRAVVVLSRGGIYREHPAAAMDSQEPHIRNLLAFIGITDVLFVRAEGLAMGPE
ncbi:MAG: FMN-dependent NADH-azoreductase, partial [Verrucomicrobiaceae bacterium]